MKRILFHGKNDSGFILLRTLVGIFIISIALSTFCVVLKKKIDLTDKKSKCFYENLKKDNLKLISEAKNAAG